jgi:C-terminal processing protease CtpA/Prc
MEKKSSWKKYMDVIHPESELLNVYRELRHAFNREGWTEKDLEKVPYYPLDIMNGYQKISNLVTKLQSEMKSYFGNIDTEEFSDYIQSKLKRIDLEIPLKNGNIKRNNPRDEDN